MGSTLNTLIVVGALGIVAWIAIGSPMTIADLKTDIQNIKNQWAGPGATPATPGAAPAAAGDTSGTDTSGAGDTGAGATDTTAQQPAQPPLASDTTLPQASQQPTPPQFLDLSSLIPPQQDTGTTSGTAAPAPPISPVAVTTPVSAQTPTPTPGVHPRHPHHRRVAPGTAGLTPQEIATGKVTKVHHHPPHSVAKTLPHGYGKGTPGWYTAVGHHHCVKGTPGCICTDKSKCHVTHVVAHHNTQHHKKKTTHAHLAHAYTGQFHYAEYTPTSNMHWGY